MTFDPQVVCTVLEEEGVRFVLIGGFAATIHGSPLPTSDVDIVPARDDDNLERVARPSLACTAVVEPKRDSSKFGSIPHVLAGGTPHRV